MATRKHTPAARPAFAMTITGGAGLGGKTFAEPSLAALVDSFTRWRDETGFGASDIGSRWPVFHDGRRVGVLSYNGRWSPEGQP